MGISLNQWFHSGECFTGRAATLNVLSVLAEKQLTQIKGEALSCPSDYSGAHYSQQTARIEHLSRLLMGVIPASTELASVCAEIREQIIIGTNPESNGFWQWPVNYDQRVVEMVALAMALTDARQQFWEPLNIGEKQNLTDWLLTVQTLEIPPNNWRWFRVLILTSLDKLGVEIDRSVLEEDLDFIDALYGQDGWYQDGASGVFDYYNPFAFQLYALVYCRWNGYKGPRCERLLQRACEFAQTYQVWFGSDGQQLCYGRSLNYRFASLAFWAEMARCEHPAVDVTRARAIWHHGMRWWAGKPIWEENGQLLPGYAYPNLLTTEFYTSPVSPLLAFKAFNALALSENHAFWLADVAEIPSVHSPTWIGESHLVWRNRGCYLMTNGPASSELRHCEDKYSKFAYSSDHGFSVESTRWIDQGWAGDNIMAVQHPQTGQWIGRSRNLSAYREGDALVSVWSPFDGCTINVVQTLHDGKERRRVEVSAEEELHLIITGYAVDKWVPWYSHLEEQEPKICSNRLFSEMKITQGSGTTHIYPCAPNTNLLYIHACVPAVVTPVTKGKSIIEVELFAGCTKN
ncbi:DUF2264 domain-containing protein [Vibrio albus]|uniref:DUF2264 domain-containing protein n=1 Tax=Vibrio albus TaxID=2200953 RepID=UPI0015E868B6|nr:DUF2264 domain-containing protein [Vibrio albus]